MTPQEIPYGEQLMGLTSEPRVQANMEFFLKGLIWPTPEAIESQSDKVAQADVDLLNDTIGWISRVLKPDLVAPDLRSRLRAARAIVSGQDAFLARYRMDQNSIQIVVTRFHVHLVIAPCGGSPLAAMHQFLQLDQPGDEHPWNGPWQTGQIGALTYGYQPRGSEADWRDSVFYLTNGRAVKFSLKKIAVRPGGSGKVKSIIAPTEESERHWFDAKP
jgi:hypothetical protein